MLAILYYEYDCISVCHKNIITIHSLVYRLGYHDATVLITIGYHKAITNIAVASLSMHESLHLLNTKNSHYLFIFVCSANNTHNIYRVLYHIKQYIFSHAKSWRCIFLYIEFIWVTLLNKILQVLGAQFYNIRQYILM